MSQIWFLLFELQNVSSIWSTVSSSIKQEQYYKQAMEKQQKMMEYQQKQRQIMQSQQMQQAYKRKLSGFLVRGAPTPHPIHPQMRNLGLNGILQMNQIPLNNNQNFNQNNQQNSQQNSQQNMNGQN